MVILKFEFPFFYCLGIILLGVGTNVYLQFRNTQSQINNLNSTIYLLYDLFQLAILLYLTGGIYNPFCLFLIAPVIISASHLKIGYSIFLSIFSILIIFLLSFYYIEIFWPEKFLVPRLFTSGLVLALVIAIIFIAVYVYILSNSSRKLSNALNQTQIALINQKR